MDTLQQKLAQWIWYKVIGTKWYYSVNFLGMEGKERGEGEGVGRKGEGKFVHY